MALTLRPTGLFSPASKEPVEFLIYDDGEAVGRIYKIGRGDASRCPMVLVDHRVRRSDAGHCDERESCDAGGSESTVSAELAEGEGAFPSRRARARVSWPSSWPSWKHLIGMEDTMPKCARERNRMVLPVRIELTTSPLPRECSTTELRQRRAGCDIARNAAANAAILATRPKAAQARRFPPTVAPGPSFAWRRLVSCPRHGRSCEELGKSEPPATPGRGVAGEPQASQGAGERACDRAGGGPQTPR
jgi:hypothetical protein